MAPPPNERALLAPFDLRSLDADQSTICALDESLRVTYVNPAWLAFGRANGACEDERRWALGAEVMTVVPPPLRAFYEALYARALRDEEVQHHSYECSSPTVMRMFHMAVHPIRHGRIVVVSSLSVETAHEAPPQESERIRYRDDLGIVHQCSHCRRVRRADAATVWDWVPAFVARMPPQTSHGLCEVCLAYHYDP